MTWPAAQELKAGIIPLIQELKGGTAPDASWLRGDWDVKKQSELCDTIAKEMGFNTERGRLDVSVHPFTGGAHPTDVRMTTRFKADDMTEGLTGGGGRAPCCCCAPQMHCG